MFSIIRKWFSSLSAFQTDELGNLYQLTYLALFQEIKITAPSCCRKKTWNDYSYDLQPHPSVEPV